MKTKLTRWLVVAATLAMSSQAFASATRTVEAQFIKNGSATLTIPASTDSLVGLNTSDILTNKTISGASNTLSNIPVSAISTGTGLSVQSGGTGDTTLTLNGMLYGNGTSAVGITAAGTQYQVFQAGASGVPTVGAVHLDQTAAVTGALPIGNGGTGQTTATAAFDALSPLTTKGDIIVYSGSHNVRLPVGTNGQVLTANSGATNGVDWESASVTPSLNGGSGAPESVTAAGGVTLTSITYNNYVWVVGSPGAVTVTATPSITACTLDGQRLTVIGTDNTKTVHLQDQANLASSGLSMNGDITLAKDSVITFHCDQTQSLWVEDNRR